MTTKEKIVRQSLVAANKRLKYLEGIQDASPASDLIDIRKEAQQLLNENKGLEARTSKSFMAKLDLLSKREKACWKMINRKKKWEKDSDEMVQLMGEISDLKNELFYIENIKL